MRLLSGFGESDRPERRGMEVQSHATHLLIRPQGSQLPEEELRLEIHASSTNQELELVYQLRGDWKIRPRALMTTMFSRLFLSDLFLHGIGGAKYDQVTDSLMASFFGITPPAYMTLTATMHLPIARPHVEQDDLRQVKGMLRDLWFHPDISEATMAPIESAEFDALVKQKKQLLGAIPPQRQRKKWNNDLQQVNDQLRTFVSDSVAILNTEKDRLASELRKDTLLSSRENSICLYSHPVLGRTLLDLCRRTL